MDQCCSIYYYETDSSTWAVALYSSSVVNMGLLDFFKSLSAQADSHV